MKERKGNKKADYVTKILKMLSNELSNLYGKGFSQLNLQSMRNFYLEYGKCQILSIKLSCSHFLLFLGAQIRMLVYFMSTNVKIQN